MSSNKSLPQRRKQLMFKSTYLSLTPPFGNDT